MVNLLVHFGQPGTLRGAGSPKLIVRNRSGKGVAVTRDEFFEWERKGRRAR